MDNVVSLEQLLNVRETMQSITESQEIENNLLNYSIINQYDVIKIKKKLLNLFSVFKASKYYYEVSVEDAVKLSANYDLHIESFSQRKNKSQVENAVQRFLDKKLLTTQIYNSLMQLSCKLNYDEIIYLVNTFFVHRTEVDIAEMLGFSKTFLQNIKKSCIVKMWIELEQYCPEDD